MYNERARIATIRRQRAAAAAERRRAGLAAAERRRATQRRVERAAVVQRTVQHRRTRIVSRSPSSGAVRPGMSAVLSYARAQVGKSYRSGGEGPGSFDCSGFTKRAYAQAGLRLPHSSGAQAARAHNVSRASAQPGDLVVGPGHVGIYMGGGMMIDAGNSRIGVVYRRLYSGLWIKRF